ncbi:MAG TPA: hypothetical protein VKQ09_01905 [Sphingomonas sp.]|nr:hypothetical protein [Sphingomonas sp.]
MRSTGTLLRSTGATAGSESDAASGVRRGLRQWIGLDAGNGISPDEAYVRVAVGLDYRDAAPVAGARVGGGAETMQVEVSVAQALVARQD